MRRYDFARLEGCRRLVATLPALLALTMPIHLSAQHSTPPVQGTIATEGTMKSFYRAANTIIVKTLDGVEHVYHFAKDLVVHGGKGPDALEGLREGRAVVLHYSVDAAGQSVHEIDQVGDDGLLVTEGVVTHIDRGRKQITVRYDNGRIETFRLTDYAAAESTSDRADATQAKVVIYYSDEKGQKVAHYFKKISKR